MLDKPTKDEFVSIARDMETFHGIFAQLWRMGRPSFSDSIETACVSFDRDGKYVSFLFNPEFWQECSDVKRKFVIAHESLHVLLSHGQRIQKLDKDIANKAADIVINESLVSQFGFDREDIDPERKYCWLDTLFSKDDEVEPDKCFEYYYELLMKKKKAGGSGAKGLQGAVTVDDHKGLGSFTEEVSKALSSKIAESLSDEEIESISDRLKEIEKKEDKSSPKDKQDSLAGTMAGNIVKEMIFRRVPKKRKWEIIIKKWARKYLIQKDKDNEQWAVLNRRLAMLPKEMFLPSDCEVEDREKEEHRIEVWFYQDTSGSCAHLAERFFKAALSLPEDRFDVKMHCFDTRIYDVDLKNPKVQGFGGTSFDIIETHIQSQIAAGKVRGYPDAVFVVTDGDGNKVSPAQPKKWFWFLSVDHRYCIPEQCNIYDLKDFE